MLISELDVFLMPVLSARIRPDGGCKSYLLGGVQFANTDRQTYEATFVPVWPDWLEFDGLYFQTAPS